MLVIPAIDLKDGQCVRLRQGDMEDSTVFSDDPVATAERWAEATARRLHMVDLNGAFAGKPKNAEAVRAITLALPACLYKSAVASAIARPSKVTSMPV